MLFRSGMAWSLLFRCGVSTAMRHVRIGGLLVSQDFPLGLKPVTKGPLADTSLVDLVGPLGDPCVKIFRCRRRSRTLLSAARGFSTGYPRFFRFHASHLYGIDPESEWCRKARPPAGRCHVTLQKEKSLLYGSLLLCHNLVLDLLVCRSWNNFLLY